MRSRKAILDSCTYKKQFQGTLAQAAILEALLDIRQFLNATASISEKALEEIEEEAKNQ